DNLSRRKILSDNELLDKQNQATTTKIVDAFGSLSTPITTANLQQNQQRVSSADGPNQSAESSGINDFDISGIRPRQSDDYSSRISLKEIYNDNKIIKKALLELTENVKILSAQRNATEENDEMVEIGNKGSGIFITKVQWDTAKSKSTYNSMGTALVMAMFPIDVLLKNNLRGGKSKFKFSTEQRVGLDKNIMDAIRVTVKKQHPQSYQRGFLGQSINNFLNDLRRKHKVDNCE
ncbi:Protein of unknown function, partial [Cotesia congregata]